MSAKDTLKLSFSVTFDPPVEKAETVDVPFESEVPWIQLSPIHQDAIKIRAYVLIMQQGFKVDTKTGIFRIDRVVFNKA